MNFLLLLMIIVTIAFLAIMLLLCYAKRHDKDLKSEQKCCDETIKRIRNACKN
jgi:preprotein translocase subunit SecG